MIRLVDILGSIFILIFFFPMFLICCLFIVMEDGFPVIFKQERIGKGGRPFILYKLRSMQKRKEAGSSITIGSKDPRILRSGYFIRKYKIDELPQLWNVIRGDMSLVGPRPEVKKYTDTYSEEQRKVLEVRPGITDNASIVFKDENIILAKQSDPENYYVTELIPYKIELNRQFLEKPSLQNYLSIIWRTIHSIFRKS